MIDRIFRKGRKPLNEAILEAVRELGKCYSRIELLRSKLTKRSKDLFDSCVSCMERGLKTKASIYANEIAEIRRILSTLEYIQLSVERAILRLDTIKMVSSNLESLRSIFGEVRAALNLIADVMPSMIPEVDRLNSVVNEIIKETEFSMQVPTPIAMNDPSVEGILYEAASVAQERMKTKLPEPPLEGHAVTSGSARRLVAVSALGDESAEPETNSSSDKKFDLSSFLTEELVMDYIERNDGNMDVARCARELNMPYERVLSTLDSLRRKGKLKVKQWRR